MKRLIELANKIKNKNLREKTIKLLKTPSLSNPELVYPAAKLEKCPSWIGTHHSNEGGLLEHTLSVTKLSIKTADTLKEVYNADINYDHLIAGALLHDISRVFLLKKDKMWDFTGSILDHASFSACELYAREFPEEVIHIVEAHGGDSGASSAHPRTIEALIVHHADVTDASAESMIRGVANPLQLLLLGEE
jgi:putative nucleotidyltransferase with HDIG domain